MLNRSNRRTDGWMEQQYQISGSSPVTHRVLERTEMIVTMTTRSSRGVTMATTGTSSEEEKIPEYQTGSIIFILWDSDAGLVWQIAEHVDVISCCHQQVAHEDQANQQWGMSDFPQTKNSHHTVQTPTNQEFLAAQINSLLFNFTQSKTTSWFLFHLSFGAEQLTIESGHRDDDSGNIVSQ